MSTTTEQELFSLLEEIRPYFAERAKRKPTDHKPPHAPSTTWYSHTLSRIDALFVELRANQPPASNPPLQPVDVLEIEVEADTAMAMRHAEDEDTDAEETSVFTSVEYNWKMISIVKNDYGRVSEFMASTDMDGIGVLVQWYRDRNDNWHAVAVDTEQATLVKEGDEVPIDPTAIIEKILGN